MRPLPGPYRLQGQGAFADDSWNPEEPPHRAVAEALIDERESCRHCLGVVHSEHMFASEADATTPTIRETRACWKGNTGQA